MPRIDDEHRLARYAKNALRENALHTMNSLLADRERELIQQFIMPALPVVFIVGAPRCGSTLLSQLLSHTGHFAYISNFLARFFMVPYIGSHIERALSIRDPRSIDFTSEFGITSNWSGPHEFGYFWERWFTYRDTHKVAESDLQAAEHQLLRQEVAAIESSWNLPVLFKCLGCSLQIRWLADVLPTARFIFVERDPLYHAQSLLICRRKRLGSERHWFSLRPAEYPMLKDLTPEEQVVAQIWYTTQAIRHSLSTLAPSSWIHISYENECRSPKNVLAQIGDFLGTDSDQCDVGLSCPGSFPTANRQLLPDDVFRRLQHYCETYFVKDL